MSGPWEPAGKPGQAGEDLDTTPALRLSPGAEGRQRAQLSFPGQSRAAGDGRRAGGKGVLATSCLSVSYHVTLFITLAGADEHLPH